MVGVVRCTPFTDDYEMCRYFVSIERGHRLIDIRYFDDEKKARDYYATALAKYLDCKVEYDQDRQH